MKKSFRNKWIVYGAAVIVLLAILYNVIDPAEPSLRRAAVHPGSDIATLKTSGGKEFLLAGKNSRTFTVPGANITDSNGRLIYHPVSALIDTQTLATPRGGQYKLTLSDGTKVWLNAASGITFPSVFGKGKRIVRITGEVYFEVARDALRPFIVQTYREPVQVLGTAFDVNAYFDETAIKVSLVEGSVKVHIYNMQPGDGYSYGDLITTNVYQDVAWTQERFGFAHTELEAAMRQLSRWYDMEVIYPNGAPAAYLSGNLDRNTGFSGLPQGLKALGIVAKTENNQLVILGTIPK